MLHKKIQLQTKTSQILQKYFHLDFSWIPYSMMPQILHDISIQIQTLKCKGTPYDPCNSPR